jgi:hypothetical protein
MVRLEMKALLVAAVVAFAVVGCVPFPSKVQRSPEVRGHVVNAMTGAPVSEARASFIDDQNIAATADEHGDFTIRETKTFELFRPIGMCGPEVFLHDWHPPNIRVTREGYSPVEVYAYDEKTVDFSRCNPKPPNAWMIKGPIFLKPVILQPLRQ